MSYPFIVHDNRFADATPVASSTASGAAVNLSDFRPYTVWSPSAMPATVTVDCGVAVAADCLALYNHVSRGATYEVHGSTDNFVASDVTVGTVWADTDDPSILKFNSASYRYWRLVALGCENLFQYSEQFDNAYWTKTRASITADATVAPDGTSTADALIEDGTAANSHILFRTETPTVGTRYTQSIYAKAKSGSRGLYMFSGSASFGANQTAHFNIDTGAIIATTGGATATITAVGNGWYRCSMTTVACTAAVATAFTYYLTDLVGLTYNGDATSGIYVWGAQLEAAPNLSDYIKTTTAALDNPPILSVVAIGTGLPMPKGVPYGIDPLARRVQAQTNVSETGLPLGKNVLFEEWSQSLNFHNVENTWLRATFIPAWKAGLRDQPFLIALDLDAWPDEIYLVEAGADLKTPSSMALRSHLQFSVKGVAL